MDKDEETGKVSGAKPDDTEGDDTGSSADDNGESEEQLPFDKHPKWQSARKAEKLLSDLMGEHEFESVDDLKEFIGSSKSIQAKFKGLDVDKLITRDKLLTSYEEYWASKEEENRRKEETPNDTVKRLEGRIKELEGTHQSEQESKKAIEESKRNVENFNNEVRSFTGSLEVPDYQKELLSFVMGVDNPTLDIDITDKKAVRKVAKDISAKVDKFVTQVIDDYVAGKRKITKVPKADETKAPFEGERKAKNLKEARRFLTETLTRRFSK